MSEMTMPRRGCMMTSALYLKANGEMPCWDDVGESKILRQLDAAALEDGQEKGLSSFDAIKHIRKSFAAGEFPHPGLCEGCAVNQAGPDAHSLDPTTLEVVHVEPSYMCHLSCPQCIPQKMRKKLKAPPFHMSAESYEGFLKQLRSEGVTRVKLFVFEGRGDPLNCADLETMIALTKQYYPSASTSITTHGSFPYKPWIAQSKLDVIRFSVDGAREESYGRYRIGGKLPLALDFMEGIIRDRPAGSRLYVEWKYILFEWTDSDEELAEAHAIAEKLGVQLRFCRTHSPGRSQRFPTAASVAEMIKRLAPRALQDMTFQLKEDGDYAQTDVVRDDQIRSLVRAAIDRLAAGNEPLARMAVDEAMAVDGGGVTIDADSIESLKDYLGSCVDAVMLPATAMALADIARTIGDRDTAADLIEAFVRLSPDEWDREKHLADAAIERVLSAMDAGDVEGATRAAATMLGQPAGETLMLIGPAFASDHPGVLAVMANLFATAGHPAPAALLFDRYLEMAPAAADFTQVARYVARLRRDRAAAVALTQAQLGNVEQASRMFGDAVMAELSQQRETAAPMLETSQWVAAGPFLETMASIAAEAGEFEAAYHIERRRHSAG